MFIFPITHSAFWGDPVPTRLDMDGKNVNSASLLHRGVVLLVGGTEVP